MKTRRFSHVHIAGEWEPEFHSPALSMDQACDRYAAQAAAAGATALQLNFITTPYHPLLYTFPDEAYLYFGNYGASLDMFAESEYTKAVWPRWLLEENLRRLYHLACAAETRGLTGLLFLCEPRMQHPEIFRRYPHWRGPRVDNPRHSQTPLFALDTDHPEVLNHYQQMMRRVLQVAPSIRHVVLFSQDSGSGFSHADHLYSGKTGQLFDCRKSVAQRVIDFCAGLRVDPRIDVTITTSYSHAEWEQLQVIAPEGVHLAVRGAQSWTGGLEDQWAWNQCGAGRLERIGFDAARAERVAEFQELTKFVKRRGRKARCLSPAPNEHYFQLAYVPNPWEQLQILQRYEQWDVDQLFLRGHITSDDQVRFNVNQSSCARFLRTPGMSPEEAVLDTLSEWAVPAVVEALADALRHVAAAVRFRPNFCPLLEREAQLFPGSLVPDPTRLTFLEKDYYWHLGQETLRRVKGDHYWMPSLSKIQLDYIFQQYERSTFAEIAVALRRFERARQSAGGDQPSLECIDCQEKHTRLYQCLEITRRNLAQMVVHWRGIQEVPVPAPDAIVDAEIGNTRSWIKLLGDNPERAVRLTPFKGAMYAASVSIREDLHRRIEAMLKHRADAVHRLDPQGPESKTTRTCDES